MPQPMTFAILGGLAVVGAAAGGWAGREAIAEINPLYFSERADSFHGDRVAYRSPDWAPSDSGGIEDAPLVEGLGDGCLTCGAPEIRLPRSALPAVYQEHWEQEAAAPRHAAVVVEMEPDPELERLRRYSSYPITAEEAERAAAASEPAPDLEVYAGAEPEAL